MNYKIFKAQDKNFICQIFEKKSQIYFPNVKNKKINKILIEKKSQDWAKKTFLVKYKIFFGKNQIKNIRGTAKKDSSKKNVWQIMNFVYASGFDKGNLLIRKPLDFISDINLLLYEQAPGVPFSFTIEKGNYPQIKKGLKRAAKWLVKLHSLKVNNKKIKKAEFLGSKNYTKSLRDIKRLIPSLKKDVELLPDFRFLDKYWEKETTLIHNDFYPSNVVLGKKNTYGIDFDKAGLGPPLMDVATLCGALEFPQEIWTKNLSKKQVLKLQEDFLKDYCKIRKINIKENKKTLKAFLVKVFLDQLSLDYYYGFVKKGWKFIDESTKKHYVLKLRSLILKTKEKIDNL